MLPRDTALTRRLFTAVLLKHRPEIEATLVTCFTSSETVRACLEPLARLEEELP